MKIRVNLEVSETKKSETFTLEDLDTTEQEWEEMSEEERQELLNAAVNNLNEQPYCVLDSFEER